MKAKTLCIALALYSFLAGNPLFATELNKNTLENLKVSICNPEPELVPSLLKQGVSPHIKLPGNASLLQIAIFTGAPIDCIRALIQEGVDVNNRDDNGSTAIMATIACAMINKEQYSHYIKVINVLIKNGADINLCANDGSFVFEILCRSKDVKRLEELITLLLEAGANPNTPSNGYTALHAAIDSKASLNIIEKLLKHGANPNSKEEFPGFIKDVTPIQLAILLDRDVLVIEALLKAHADANQANTKGFLPLHLLILRAHAQMTSNMIDIAKILLKYGANPHTQDIIPLAQSTLGREHPIVEILTKGTAD